MSENWAARELTEEEQKEVQEEIANASEDEPAPDTSRDPKWEGDDRDKRPPSEKYIEEPEGEPEPEKKADPPKDTPKEEKEAEKPAEDIPAVESKEPQWMQDLTPEQKKHFGGLKSEIASVREQRKTDRLEAERRFVESAQTVKDQIAQAFKENQPVPEVPDKELYPEEYASHMEAEAKSANEQLEKVRTETNVVQDNQELLAWMGQYEVDDPDFKPAFDKLKNHFVQDYIAQGYSQNGAEEKFQTFGLEVGARVRKEGVDWSKFVKYQASQLPVQTEENTTMSETEKPVEEKTKGDGKEIAKSVTAGEKAAKGLSGGGGASVGVLTIEDITRIEDPEEHKAAYEAWVEEQIGQTGGWK